MPIKECMAYFAVTSQGYRKNKARQRCRALFSDQALLNRLYSAVTGNGGSQLYNLVTVFNITSGIENHKLKSGTQFS